MDVNLILGVVVIVVAFGFTAFLTIYSSRSIDLIAEKKLNSLREIQKELRHGR